MGYRFRSEFAEALWNAGIPDNSEMAEAFYMHPINYIEYINHRIKFYSDNRYPETMEFQSGFALNYLKIFKLESEKDPITFIQYSNDVCKAIFNLSTMIKDWMKFNSDKIQELYEVLAYIIDHTYTSNIEYGFTIWKLYSELNGPANLIKLNTLKSHDPEYIPD